MARVAVLREERLDISLVVHLDGGRRGKRPGLRLRGERERHREKQRNHRFHSASHGPSFDSHGELTAEELCMSGNRVTTPAELGYLGYYGPTRKDVNSRQLTKRRRRRWASA